MASSLAVRIRVAITSSTRTTALKTAMATAQLDGGHDVHECGVRSVGVVERLGLLDADDDVAIDDADLLLVGELEASGGDAVEVA